MCCSGEGGGPTLATSWKVQKDGALLFTLRTDARFTDGSSLQVINETPTFEPGSGRMFGPFLAVPGKRTNLMNFRVGSSSQPAALGFSYRISVQGCT